VIEKLKAWLAGLGNEPTVIICGGSALLIISHYQGGTGAIGTVFGGRFNDHPAAGAISHFYWFGASLFLYLVMPLLLSTATRGSFHRSYGMGLGDWRAGFTVAGLFLAVMLPAVYVASTMKAFQGQYPLAGIAAYTLQPKDGLAKLSWSLFLIYECGYFLYFVGWEFFFRGWMLNGLLPTFGRAGALLIPVAPFAIMHLGKAELEALGSIIAGLALGLLALRTRSFWYGALVHGIVAVFMDLLAVKDRFLHS
jgi:membrane protease YdiL (CAAX protease family)